MATKKRKGTRAKAGAQREWNGAERFDAIAPVMGQIMQARTARAAASHTPGMLSSLQAEEAGIQQAIASAAKASGASAAQISAWVDSFSALGKPGLMADIPLSATDCCANLQGTFELTSRFSNGVETATRGRLYNDMDPKKLRGTQLITMWTEENLVKRSGSKTLLLIAFGELQFKQNGPYEVIVNSSGIIYGNYADYEKGVKATDEFRLVRKGQNESMLGVTERTQTGGADSAGRSLIEVGGDPGTIKYKMWGVPATKEYPRTQDTVDTYQIMSNRRPLVGGWEPIKDYFQRVTQGKGTKGAKAGGVSLLESPGDRQELLRACEDLAVPRNSRWY